LAFRTASAPMALWNGRCREALGARAPRTAACPCGQGAATPRKRQARRRHDQAYQLRRKANSRRRRPGRSELQRCGGGDHPGPCRRKNSGGVKSLFGEGMPIFSIPRGLKAATSGDQQAARQQPQPKLFKEGFKCKQACASWISHARASPPTGPGNRARPNFTELT